MQLFNWEMFVRQSILHFDDFPHHTSAVEKGLSVDAFAYFKQYMCQNQPLKP